MRSLQRQPKEDSRSDSSQKAEECTVGFGGHWCKAMAADGNERATLRALGVQGGSGSREESMRVGPMGKEASWKPRTLTASDPRLGVRPVTERVCRKVTFEIAMPRLGT